MNVRTVHYVNLVGSANCETRDAKVEAPKMEMLMIMERNSGGLQRSGSDVKQMLFFCFEKSVLVICCCVWLPSSSW